MALLALLGALTGACGEGRPTVAEWEQQWDRVVGLLPDLSSLEPPDEALCQTTLASLRTESDSLIPPPDPTIDDTVNQWIETAEATFFNCPPTGEIDGFADAYDVLFRLQGEIETVLEIDRG